MAMKGKNGLNSEVFMANAAGEVIHLSSRGCSHGEKWIPNVLPQDEKPMESLPAVSSSTNIYRDVSVPVEKLRRGSREGHPT